MVAYGLAVLVPSEDPTIAPVLDEHGELVVDPDDPDPPPLPARVGEPAALTPELRERLASQRM
jgi:hypothetical protein